MSDPALPSFPIDVFAKLPSAERPSYATLGHVFDLDALCAGSVTWDSMVGVVFTPDGQKLDEAGRRFVHVVGDLDVARRRFVALDDPRLYPAVGLVIQHKLFDAIVLVRRDLKIGLAEAKGLVEAVLAEGLDRGVITSVGLVDGRLAVERESDVQRAQDMQSAFEDIGITFESGEIRRGGDVYSPKIAERLRVSIAEFAARPEVQAQIRELSRPWPMSVSCVTGVTTKPADGYAVDLQMSTTQLQVFNPPESKGPLCMETLKARDNGAGVGLTFMLPDDFKDALMDWTLDPTAERYEKLSQAKVALESPSNPREARSDTFDDAFCPLEAVLSNLGLGEQYQSTLLANLDKHQPEIYAAITVLRSKLVCDEDPTATPAS